MSTRVPMPVVRTRVSYLIDKLEDDIEGALYLGLHRAYKHTSEKPPDNEAERRIVETQHIEIMGCIFEALDFYPADAAPACDCCRDDDDCGVEQVDDDDQ